MLQKSYPKHDSSLNNIYGAGRMIRNGIIIVSKVIAITLPQDCLLVNVLHSTTGRVISLDHYSAAFDQ